MVPMASTKTVHVEPDAIQALKDATYARYGRIHGALYKEASKALRAHAEKMMADLAGEPATEGPS
jgi:hypothetical protein